MITFSLSDVIHWIFAFKYWTVACKLEQLKRGANPDEYNLCYSVIFWAGIFVNLVTGVIFTLKGFFVKITPKASEISTSVFMLPLILSCIFLCDAFRRFRKTKEAT